MKSFKLINNITGWAIFAIATTVYVLTLEPTASFWDCGEFIAVSYKLMTPHPPGAPFFLLVGRMFSLFAGDVTQVAYWINMVSALSSSFTILFLFWSITLIAKKLIKPTTEEGYDLGQTILIMGAGVVGSLSYTFSDSFWFSAVEAEVYAMSAFFTSFVVWAMLKWESIADEEGSDRWLILIAYMVGLSIGVHLLNLVAIPALGFIFYFKRYKPSTIGYIATFGVSSLILGIILVVIIPGLPSIAGAFEILFVNSFGFKFNSGVIFFSVLFISILIGAIIFSIKINNRILNTALLGLTFILIGYSSYGIILIRSNFNPPIDENNPEEVMKFVSYLKREQYGDRPLFLGPYFTASPDEQVDGDPLYTRGEDGKYVIYDYKTENKYLSKDLRLFPRMHSRQGHHVREYEQLLKSYTDGEWYNAQQNSTATNGSVTEADEITSADNIKYLIDRQLGKMYWRYFFWNFIGRDGDIQDSGVMMPFDTPNEELPREVQSFARNNFYALPFILGLIGLLFQFYTDKKTFSIVAMLFFFTGIAIILYLNAPPIEPRERDYAYAGSYYAYCFWIGFGVLGLGDILLRVIKNKKVVAIVATVLGMGIPAIMAAQGWDDHDRSNRYHSVDSAKNLLDSCEKNAILFTGGDNDTFPLWYVQEVEGYRTDVRVCNLSLLNTDWYIDQMKKKYYDSEALPISLDNKNYIQGTNDVLYYMSRSGGKDRPLRLDNYIKAVKKGSKQIRYAIGGDRFQQYINIFPSKLLVLPIDENVARSVVPDKYKKFVRNKLEWNIKKKHLEKKDLIMLDMITNISKSGWKRPIYFSTTLGPSNYLNLKDHMVLEGLAYRLLPANHGDSNGEINTDKMYDNLMNKFQWREMDNAEVFYDENYKRFVFNARFQYYVLAGQLMNEGKKEKARAVIEHSLRVLPDYVFPYGEYTAQYVDLLFALEQDQKALELAKLMGDRAIEMIEYTLDTPTADRSMINRKSYVLQTVGRALMKYGHKKEATIYMKALQSYQLLR
ncbi:MAG: DUF2723 domain-containing protein [Cytophagales bacterium]|nr:DUF2723 domain-containing protein [Cytophagales bacterium]